MFKRFLSSLLIMCFFIGIFGIIPVNVYANSGITPVIEVLPGLEVEVGEEVFFSAENSKYNGGEVPRDLIRYEWDFGDGYNMRPIPLQDGNTNNGYGGLACIHYFMKPGTFEVKLKMSKFNTVDETRNGNLQNPVEQAETSVLITVTGEAPIKGFEVLRAPFNARIAQFITVVIPEEVVSPGTNKLVVTLEGKNRNTSETLVNETITSSQVKYKLETGKLNADEYRLVTRLIDENNEQISIWVDKFTKTYDGLPEVGINEWNAICRKVGENEAEPFFPVNMFWLYTNQFNSFDGCGTGIYCMQGSSSATLQGWTDYVQLANSKGWDMIGPGDIPNSKLRYASLKEREPFINAVKDNPKLLMWTWQDEPNFNQTTRTYQEVPPPVIAAWTYHTNLLDSKRPVTVNLYGFDFLPHYYSVGTGTRWFSYDVSDEIFGGKRAFYTDVVDMDLYMHEYADHSALNNKPENGPVALWVEAVDNFIKWDYDLVPHGIFIQPNDGRENATPTPTHEQILMQAWLAVVHGAKQIVWFPYHVQGSRDYSAMRKFNTSMETYGKIILSSPEGYEQITDNSNARTNRVDTLTRKDGDDIYLFAVRLTEPEPLPNQDNHWRPENLEPDVITTTFTVPDFNDGYAYVLDIYGNVVDFIPIEDGTFTDTFEKEAYRIYRINEDSTPVNLLSIPQDMQIETVPKRKEKSADALGLPDTIPVETDKGTKEAKVSWDVENSSYNPESKIPQTVNIAGTVILPDYINQNGVDLDLSLVLNVNPKNAWIASNGFSSTQGKNQWYYYSYLSSGGGLMTWSDSLGLWISTPNDRVHIMENQYWLLDRRTYVARAWEAPIKGTVSIESQISFPDGTEDGDYVIVKVRKNDVTIWGNKVTYVKPEPTPESVAIIELEPSLEAGPKSEPSLESELESEPESTPESEPESEPESTSEPELDSEPESTSEPEPESELESTSEPESESEPEPTPEPTPTAIPAPADINLTGIEVNKGDKIYFEVRVEDGSGVSDVYVIWDPTITLTEPDGPPVWNTIGDKLAYTGKELTFTISAEDPNDDLLTYACTSGLPDGASFDPTTRTFIWTPLESQAGVYNVTFTVADNNSTVPMTVKIYAMIPATIVEISGDNSISMMKGEDITLTATVSPENATNKTVIWTTDNPRVAIVDAVSGKVTARRAGTAEITARVTVDGQYVMDKCTITVVQPPELEGIAVTTPPDKTTYYVGEALDLTGLVVTGTYGDGTTTELTITQGNISGFDSSKPAEAQIVTITYGEKTATFTVNIIPREGYDFVIENPSLSVGAGITAQATITPIIPGGGNAVVIFKLMQGDTVLGLYSGEFPITDSVNLKVKFHGYSGDQYKVKIYVWDKLDDSVDSIGVDLALPVVVSQ